MKRASMGIRFCRVLLLSLVMVAATVYSVAVLHAAEDIKAEDQAPAISGGIAVVVWPGNAGDILSGLIDKPFYVQLLLPPDSDLNLIGKQLVRKRIAERVALRHFSGGPLPYRENTVNLLVLERQYLEQCDPKLLAAEVERVLVPDGLALIDAELPQLEGVQRALQQAGLKQHEQRIRWQGRFWVQLSKPWPDGIDCWSHTLHGPDGNPVANDLHVAPPKHIQWWAGPLWLRSHDSDSSISAFVTAGGRVFYIIDEAPAGIVGNHSVPDKWFLVCRDAFNGALLWKRPINDWGWHAWKNTWFQTRMGAFPINLDKRLVASGDRVYVTLGYHAPVSVLDAATGKTLQVLRGTENANEILVLEDYILVAAHNGQSVKIVAFELSSGEPIWDTNFRFRGTTNEIIKWQARWGKVEPAQLAPVVSMVSDGKHICLQDANQIVCLSLSTGKELWRSKAAEKQPLMPGTLIVHDPVVIYTEPYRIQAFSLKSGEKLWEQKRFNLGFYAWKDAFVIDDLVWTWGAQTKRAAYGKDPGTGRTRFSTWPLVLEGRDLLTGKVVKAVPLDGTFAAPHHHRCYRNRATVRYILASRRGTEYIDLHGEQHYVHNWIRSTCHLGMFPANGYQYVLPHPCVCYLQEKLNGFAALAAQVEDPAQLSENMGPASKSHVLEEGPAFGKVDSVAAASEDWPCYRHDNMRSGSTDSTIGSTATPVWRSFVAGRITPPVVVGGKTYVAAVDQHRVLALDEKGKIIWDYFVGGRVDSPPAYCRGRLVFGSQDGWVYCLRASDGQLAWRHRVASSDVLVGADGQLASAWPVYGSVLVQSGLVYAAAGKSSYLDGGIYLVALDLENGRLQYRHRLTGPGDPVQRRGDNFVASSGATLSPNPDEGFLNDILLGNGKHVFLRELPLTDKLQEDRRALVARLIPKGGFLDDSYFKRAVWQLVGIKPMVSGQLIVYDAERIYVTRMFAQPRALDPNNYFTPGKDGYLLWAYSKDSTNKPIWQQRLPVRITAMVAAGDKLLIAGQPDVVDPDDPLGAFEDRKGGSLWILDASNGEPLAKYRLESSPIFNGMAVASGRIYLSCRSGHVECWQTGN